MAARASPPRLVERKARKARKAYQAGADRAARRRNAAASRKRNGGNISGTLNDLLMFPSLLVRLGQRAPASLRVPRALRFPSWSRSQRDSALRAWRALRSERGGGVESQLHVITKESRRWPDCLAVPSDAAGS